MNKKTKKHFWDYCNKNSQKYVFDFRKAQDMNLLFVSVMTLVIAITIVAGFRAVKELNTAVQNMPTANQETKDIMSKTQTNYVPVFDILFLVFFVFIAIILIASAFFIDTHPVFFIISLLMTIITGFVGAHLANAYSKFADALSSDSSAFTIIPYIFQHFVAIIVIVGMITTGVLFAKIRSASAI